MRSFEWETIEEATPGEFKKMKPGAYICKFWYAKDIEDKEYVMMVFDIAEGEFKEQYNNKWGIENPTYHCIYASYKESAKGVLKRILHKISDSNPGFDAFAAWDAGRLEMFQNRYIGITYREEEYVNKDNAIKTNVKVDGVESVPDIRAGIITTPAKKCLSDEEKKAAVLAAYRAEEVPFT